MSLALRAPCDTLNGQRRCFKDVIDDAVAWGVTMETLTSPTPGQPRRSPPRPFMPACASIQSSPTGSAANTPKSGQRSTWRSVNPGTEYGSASCAHSFLYLSKFCDQVCSRHRLPAPSPGPTCRATSRRPSPCPRWCASSFRARWLHHPKRAARLNRCARETFQRSLRSRRPFSEADQISIAKLSVGNSNAAANGNARRSTSLKAQHPLLLEPVYGEAD
jgi:hypothetical protein